MKKFLCLTVIFSAIMTSTILAQGGGNQAKASTTIPVPGSPDMAAMLKQAKEKQIPPMVEKTGLTHAQAERVIEINFRIRQASGGLRDLNEADRSAKLAELKATKERLYSEIPLTNEQIQSVYAFYADMGKNAPQRRAN